VKGGQLIETIKKRFGDQAVADAPMSSMTTFKVGGPADLLLRLDDENQVADLMSIIAGSELPVVVIGRGSNVLVMDKGIRGVVLDLSGGFRELSHKKAEDGIEVTCGASVAIAELLRYCIDHGIGGFEFAAGIPGSVGGSVRGNAGTRDGDFSKVVNKVRLVDQKGQLRTLEKSELDFRYRGLMVDGRFVILGVSMMGAPADSASIREKVNKIIDWRKQRQPYEQPSAGSVFKNPPDAPAARLIDQAGCKGLRVGGAQVSEKHANFIVNTGDAKASDILRLIDQVRKTVFEKFHVLLETEIRIYGEQDV